MAALRATHAKMPWSIVHPPGLFVSLARGERTRHELDVTYVVNEATYRFQGPELLDSTDLRVLQGLVAIATASLAATRMLLRDGRSLGPALSLSGTALSDRQFAAQAHRTLAVRLTISGFGQLLGYAKGGSTNKLIHHSLARLSVVRITIDEPGFVGKSYLVTGYKTDATTGELIVGLCPMLTRTILSRKNYLSISLDEVRQLKLDAARLLHWRLHFINQGGVCTISLEKLRGYVYAATSADTPAGTTRRRNLTIREALKELRSIGWVVIQLTKDHYQITRPSNKKPRRGVSRTQKGA